MVRCEVGVLSVRGVTMVSCGRCDSVPCERWGCGEV